MFRYYQKPQGNRIKVEIDSCAMCPSATLKSVKEEQKHIMFCQTETSCIRLREAWGDYPIPDWCPRLKQNLPKVMRKVNVIDKFSKQLADKKRCEELQAKISNGRIMTVDDFVEQVEDGLIIDDDGYGVFADYSGNKQETIWCDAVWLQDHRKNYPFIIWYNR